MNYLVHVSNHSLFGHTTFFKTKEAALTFLRAFLIMTILHGDLDNNRRGELEMMDDEALYNLHRAEGGPLCVIKPAVSMSATTLEEYYEILSRYWSAAFDKSDAHEREEAA